MPNNTNVDVKSNQLDISWLFETNALKISPASSPFWYTSGLIGPYYINTHFLCGGEKGALDLLNFIEEDAENRIGFPSRLMDRVEDIYQNFSIYRSVVDALVVAAKREFEVSSVDCISGGQRRDWFFAPIVAKRLGLPCIYLYNDLSVTSESGEAVSSLKGKRVMNIADLLTVGSSYSKKWIPAITSRGGKLEWSLNVVDRNEGAEENLSAAGVKKCHSLFVLGAGLFDRALSLRFIDQSQYDLAIAYLTNPQESMRSFLRANRGFIDEALNSGDEKKKARCELMLKENLYNL